MHPKHYEFDYFSEYPTLKVTDKTRYSHRIERRTHAWRGREVLFLPLQCSQDSKESVILQNKIEI